MRVQPQYVHKEDTPLAFFKFLRVALAIGVVCRSITVIPMLTSETDWYSIVYSLAGLALAILALWGLGRMKWMGVLASYGLSVLVIVDGIAAILLCAYYGALESSGEAIGRTVGAVLILIPLRIYFGKRRLLFDPPPAAKAAQEPVPHEAPGMGGETAGGVPSGPAAPPAAVTLETVPTDPSKTQSEEEPLKEEEPPTAKGWIKEKSGAPSEGKRNRRLWGAVLCVTAVTAVGITLWLIGSRANSPVDISTVANSVLYLEVLDENGACIATASGFLVNDRTTLVTNYHVIRDASHIVATTADGEQSTDVSRVLAYDETADLAVLSCDTEAMAEPLIIGDSEAVRQGDAIYTVGYPLGLANTLSDGIVSSRYIDEYENDIIQITAAISEGNSGGPLLNADGRVIGVMCAYYVDGQNLNIAISSNTLEELLGSGYEKRELESWKDRPAMPAENAAFSALSEWIANYGDETVGEYKAYREHKGYLRRLGDTGSYHVTDYRAIYCADIDQICLTCTAEYDEFNYTTYLWLTSTGTAFEASFYEDTADFESIFEGTGTVYASTFNEQSTFTFDSYIGDSGMVDTYQAEATRMLLDSLDFLEKIFLYYLPPFGYDFGISDFGFTL